MFGDNGRVHFFELLRFFNPRQSDLEMVSADDYNECYRFHDFLELVWLRFAVFSDKGCYSPHLFLSKKKKRRGHEVTCGALGKNF